MKSISGKEKMRESLPERDEKYIVQRKTKENM